MSFYHAIYSKGGVSPEPGGDIHGETQTLLWENRTPSVAFAAQTVTVDLTQYDGVIVEFTDTSNPAKINGRIKVSKTTELFGVGLRVTNETFARNISSLNNSGVGFSDCYKNTTVFNTGFVPLKIYGYRRYESGNLSTDANEIVVDANTDKQLDIKSYYLILGVSMNTKLSLSKGALIGSIEQSHAGGNDVAAIVYTGDDGIINSTGNSLHIKKINIG